MDEVFTFLDESIIWKNLNTIDGKNTPSTKRGSNNKIEHKDADGKRLITSLRELFQERYKDLKKTSDQLARLNKILINATFSAERSALEPNLLV